METVGSRSAPMGGTDSILICISNHPAVSMSDYIMGLRLTLSEVLGPFCTWFQLGSAMGTTV